MSEIREESEVLFKRDENLEEGSVGSNGGEFFLGNKSDLIFNILPKRRNDVAALVYRC